jgi:hypothetical protein
MDSQYTHKVVNLNFETCVVQCSAVQCIECIECIECSAVQCDFGFNISRFIISRAAALNTRIYMYLLHVLYCFRELQCVLLIKQLHR